MTEPSANPAPAGVPVLSIDLDKQRETIMTEAAALQTQLETWRRRIWFAVIGIIVAYALTFFGVVQIQSNLADDTLKTIGRLAYAIGLVGLSLFSILLLISLLRTFTQLGPKLERSRSEMQLSMLAGLDRRMAAMQSLLERHGIRDE